MSNRGRITPWGIAMLSGVDVICKVLQPVAPALPQNLLADYYPDVLFDEYSFDLERRILEEIALKEAAEKTKYYEDLKLSRTIDASESSSGKNISSFGDTAKPKQSTDKSGAQTSTTSSFYRPVPSEILTPMRPLNGSRASPSLNNVSTASCLDPMMLRDFERVDDPFDSAALSSINDMEELRGLLLQPASGGSTPPVAESVGTVAVDTEQPSSGNVSPCLSEKVPPSTCGNEKTSLSSVTFHANRVKQITFPHLGEKERKTPPLNGSVRAHHSGVTPAALANQMKHSLKLECDSSQDTQSGLSDPFSSLPASDRELVSRMTMMGFSRGCAARFLQATPLEGPLSEEDREKRLLDHLLGVASLEEMNFPGGEAEMAIHLFPRDRVKAVKFIIMKREFTEFGFPPASIHEALLASDLDKERTVIFLQRQHTTTP